MANLSPAERLAESPPTTGAHPAVVDRLVGLVQDVTLLLTTGDAATFVGGEPREALDALRTVADDLVGQADAMRPTIHTRP